LDAEVKPLDPMAMEGLIAEVVAKGDPARGEAVFRRADVNCTKCHAVSGAGGGVGPDLSALGSSSPVDYVINSIMLPDQAIKEEFHTLVVVTTEGQVFQGIVADRDDKRVVLREATGELRTVPASDIEDSKEGGSLMPRGLVNFMTRAEFVDLVRFLSELGKPGPYGIRSTPTVQRWRYLKPVPPALAGSVPDAPAFKSQVWNADPDRWLPAYARTAGDLPLDELTPEAGKVLYLQGEVEVSHGDRVVVKLNSARGVTVWVDEQRAPAFTGSEFSTELPSGRHRLTFRVDTPARNGVPLKVEVLKPPGSSAEYAVLGGR
ncbi:MAG: c-type cytochrome, partial [Planctomycetia bacterium]|nr:c-type cytochrome [Planctomycetia bacterium]